MRQNPLHENYHEDGRIEGGTDRAFGFTAGTVLVAIGAAKAFIAGAVTPASSIIFAPGAVLLLLGLVAPSRLSVLNRHWLKIGAVLGKIVNPIVLAVLFFLVVTPMALVMRAAGKRPLRLAPDRTTTSYWIAREPLEGGPSSMWRQF